MAHSLKSHELAPTKSTKNTTRVLSVLLECIFLLQENGVRFPILVRISLWPNKQMGKLSTVLVLTVR